MLIGLRARDGGEESMLLAQQLGANGCSLDGRAMPEFQETGYLTVERCWEFRRRLERFQLELTAFTHGGDVMKEQLAGRPGRDTEVENVCRTLQAMGEVYADMTPGESPVLILDQRTTYQSPGYLGGKSLPVGPGGVRLLRRDVKPAEMDSPMGEVSAAEVWERMACLYERVVPVAEESGILLATHPDDPPMEYFRGVHQVLTGLKGFAEFIERFPSPNNGLLLCLGCMAEAGENVPEVIRYFGERKRIFYVHFRNVRGTAARYDEVYPDEGQTDMRAALTALHEVGYDRSLVPDHHFGFTGHGDSLATSWAFQVGYIRGLLQGAQVPRETVTAKGEGT